MKVQLHIPPQPGAAQIILDGKDVAKDTLSVKFEAAVDTTPTLTVQYACYKTPTDVEGEFDVVHLCGLEE